MPLSEHEQRILDEIERRLTEDDPKFARGVGGSTPHGRSVRRLRRAIAGFMAGFCLLIAAIVYPAGFLGLGLASFVVMLPCAVVIATTAKSLGRERTPAVGRASWFTKMEQRWRKRFDRDES